MGFIREQFLKPLVDVVRRKRSSKWRKTRKAFVKKHPFCMCCGRVKGLEVHHIEDFSTRPELELEETNLMTLCGKYCHFVFGHLMNWQSINPEALQDATKYNYKKINRRK